MGNMVEELPKSDRLGKWDESLQETYRLLRVNDPYELRQLDTYRRKWESVHGKEKADGFSSQLNDADREKMLHGDPAAYYAGLPAFARDYYEDQCHVRIVRGGLDRLSDALIKAFVKGRGHLR